MTCRCDSCGLRWNAPDNVPCDQCRHQCREKPRDPITCRHFLGPTGDSTETHKHCGCKTATPMTALAECELHGTCTFIGRAKDERIPFCGDCKDYTTQQ